jgi:hypothetical protein
MADSPQRRAEPWALPGFCGNVLERSVIESEVSDDLLELAILRFEVPQAPQMTDLQAPYCAFQR